MPTSLVVTLVGAALTVWLAPALTHQWEDRQHARELKADVASEMVRSAAWAIDEGAQLAESRGRYSAIDDQWLQAGAMVEVKEKAYFPPSVVERWQNAVQYVRSFLIVCDDIADVHRRSGDDFTDRYARILEDLKFAAPTSLEAESAARLLAGEDPKLRASGMGQLKTWIWPTVGAAVDEVLAAHPSGFSTGRQDLLHDLLP